METEGLRVFVEITLILAAIYGAYWKSKVAHEGRFTKVETLLTGLSSDHGKLEERIHGMSRNLAELNGHVRGNGK